jgi:hypothetical protein
VAVEFVSETITPSPGTFNAAVMAIGLASPPQSFEWRGQVYRVAEVIDHAKRTSTEGARAQGGRYLRGQRVTVRLETGETAVLDFRRQTTARHGGKAAKARWTLYTIDRNPPPSPATD